MMCDDSIIVHL